LAELVSLLPMQGAMMLGLPASPPSGNVDKPQPLGLVTSARCLAGLWDGHAAIVDSKVLAAMGVLSSSSSSSSSSAEVLQPLHLVIAQESSSSNSLRIFGAGYTTWPAAAAIGPGGATYFVLLGEVGSEGRVRLRLQWDRGDVHADPSVDASQLIGQLLRNDENGLYITGVWQRQQEKVAGAFVLRKRVLGRGCAGLWQQVQRSHPDGVSFAASDAKPLAWAFSSVGPLLFGAEASPGSDPRLLRGCCTIPGVASHIGVMGETSEVTIVRHIQMPFRGSCQPTPEVLASWNSLSRQQLRGTLSSVSRKSARLKLWPEDSSYLEGETALGFTLDFVREDDFESSKQTAASSSTTFWAQEELRTPLLYYSRFDMKV